MKQIALTQTVQKGGCAAKVAAPELRRILSQVKFPKAHPALLVDGGLFDDAAIYKVSEETALVQTLDFFTPIVDSPRVFGAVAAANALSDVYAMGGKPKTAMAILAFPLATLPAEAIVEVLQGASDKIAEADADFVGGHSIDDDTLKFGLSVTGYVHPQRVWSNAQARPGDDLILTKALGTGTVTAALKRQAVQEQDIAETLQSMMKLNNAVNFLSESQLAAVHAATDITGFGLAGHSLQLAKASQVSLRIAVSSLPLLPRVSEFLQAGFLTKAHRTNLEYVAEESSFAETAPWQKQILMDPQTSGGLLLSVDPAQSESILSALRPHFPSVTRIGRVDEPRSQRVNFE